MLLSWCESQRPLAVSKRPVTWRSERVEGNKAARRHTLFLQILSFWHSVSGRERAAAMWLKWISSEKANRQTQIQGCFWLGFPLLFWSGKRSNSRRCPFFCEAVVCFCVWAPTMRGMLWLTGIWFDVWYRQRKWYISRCRPNLKKKRKRKINSGPKCSALKSKSLSFCLSCITTCQVQGWLICSRVSCVMSHECWDSSTTTVGPCWTFWLQSRRVVFPTNLIKGRTSVHTNNIFCTNRCGTGIPELSLPGFPQPFSFPPFCLLFQAWLIVPGKAISFIASK